MDIVNSWKICAPRHRVMVLSIKNPALYDMAEKEVLTTEDIFAKSAALKLIDDRQRTFSVLEKSGIHVLESTPDRFTLEAVNRYIAMKTGLSLPAVPAISAQVFVGEDLSHQAYREGLDILMM